VVARDRPLLGWSYDVAMVSFRAGPVRVRVPATSANLGPGFDALGLALGLYDHVTARVAADVSITVRVTGEGAGELPGDVTHLVASSAMAAFERMGGFPPGVDIDCVNAIPQARGLGSSSAAIVAGILVARGLTVAGDDLLDTADVLRLASEIEGHPDNVAPCLLGGFTIAWLDTDGARAVRLEPHPAVQPTVFVPAERGLTAHARSALPKVVPHSDAAHSAGRAALLVHALTADPTLLYAATEDRLHQQYRAAGLPATAELVAKLRGAGVAAVVSGAGPSVLALATGDASVPDTPGWLRLSPPCDVMGAVCEVGLGQR
jgi:homoserine kinase